MTKAHKRAGKGLRNSDEHFGLLVHHLTEYAIYMLDLEGFIISWNPGAERIKGYRAEEIVGQHFSCFYTGEDIERGKPSEQLQVAAREGGLADEGLRVRKDGSQFWASVVIAALRDEAGHLLGFAIVTRDISRRKRAEEALRESEERYRCLVGLSPYAVAVHSEERMVFVNRAGTELLGATDPEEIIGRSMWDFVHPDYLKAVRKRIQRARSEGNEVDLIEEKLVRLDGQAIDAEMAAIPITYQGKPARQIVFRDISKRKRAEEALRESEVRYRTLVETARDVIFTLSAEGTLLSLNSAFEIVTGWSRAEWLGKPFAPIIHPDDLAAGVENFRRILQGEVPPIFEIRILTKSGEYLTGEFAARPLIADGKVIGAFGIVRDITERKRAEEATERVRRRVETLVETSPVGVVVVDASGRVVLVNREAERITDFSYKRGDPLETLHQGAVRRRPHRSYTDKRCAHLGHWG